jgi:tripartite-type tricarboxylate transporter receptor subunit TctC
MNSCVFMRGTRSLVTLGWQIVNQPGCCTVGPLNRRQAVAWSAAAALPGVFPSLARADAAFPVKPVRIIVGNTAGSGADIAVRTVAKRLQDVWKQTIVVENRGGAGGLVAAEAVARSDPDGHTLSLAQEGAITIAPALPGKLNFDPQKDLAPVALLAETDYVLVAHPGTGFRSLDDLVKSARARPGAYSYASAGVGSLHHLSFELLKVDGNFFFVHIPYRGGPLGLADVVGGQVHAMFIAVSPALGHIQAGRLNALAVGGARRSPLLPGVPTLSETYAGARVTSWFSLFAPAQTPAAVVEKINRDANDALRTAEVAETLTKQGIVPVGGTPADLADLVRRDAAKYSQLATRVKLSAA